MKPKLTTIQDVIDFEVIPAVGYDNREYFDLRAIARECWTYQPESATYEQAATTGDFWRCVRRHEKPAAG